jgi:hypothetical protein
MQPFVEGADGIKPAGPSSIFAVLPCVKRSGWKDPEKRRRAQKKAPALRASAFSGRKLTFQAWFCVTITGIKRSPQLPSPPW